MGNPTGGFGAIQKCSTLPPLAQSRPRRINITGKRRPKITPNSLISNQNYFFFFLFFQSGAIKICTLLHRVLRRSVKSQYYRKINKRYPTLRCIGDPAPAWQELSQTWESRNSTNLSESYVLFEQTQPPFLIMASSLDIQTLHKSKHWVCDGTFDYCPPEFSQLYSIHGFVRGEGLPLVVGLLPDKTRASYSKFFDVVRSALVLTCGDVGELEVGHFDFEMTAIDSFEVEFPGALSKGCLFHFAQCITRKVAQLGLRVSTATSILVLKLYKT